VGGCVGAFCSYTCEVIRKVSSSYDDAHGRTEGRLKASSWDAEGGRKGGREGGEALMLLQEAELLLSANGLC
jgi:hypothetical protein